jgi:hypothetical protein
MRCDLVFGLLFSLHSAVDTCSVVTNADEFQGLAPVDLVRAWFAFLPAFLQLIPLHSSYNYNEFENKFHSMPSDVYNAFH